MQARTLKLLAILINNFFASTVYTMIAPFYPTEMKAKGISEFIIGMVFASYPVLGLFASPLLGRYLGTLGRKRVFITGVCLEVVGLFLIASVEYMDYMGAIMVSFAARAITGIAMAWIMVSSFAIIASEFPEEMQKVLGILEAVGGIGLILGPLLGAGLYQFFGFVGTFAITGSVYLCMVPICALLMKKDAPFVEKQKSSIWQLLGHRSVALNTVMIVLFNMTLGYLYPLLAIHLVDNFQQSPEIVGVLFAVTSLSYALIAPPLTLLKVEKTLIITCGAMIMGFSLYLVGPWTTIGLPSNIWVVVMGLVVFGFGSAGTFILTLPCMIERLAYEEGYEVDDKILDTLSSILTSACSFGQILGPVLSSVISLFIVDFSTRLALVGSFDIAFAFVYITFMVFLRKPKASAPLLPKLGKDTELAKLNE